MGLDAGDYLGVPSYMADEREHRIKIATVLGKVLWGKLNNRGTVTLTANQATTAVTDFRVGPNSMIILMPTTANAAAALATTYIQTAGITNEQFTITHANNAQTDRIFRYCVFG